MTSGKQSDQLSRGPSLVVTWDYTEHAEHYDKRADYAQQAIKELVSIAKCVPGEPVADIGAGTGKLTKELLDLGLTVRSVEPNAAMREFGKRNTQGKTVTWSVGTGEETGLDTHSVGAAFFGSSFNVVDQKKALHEVARILKPKRWFACMWNHRNLEDPVQKRIESIIRSYIPSYSYGLRREDPTEVIDSSGLFLKSRTIEASFNWDMSRADVIIAWKSHATVRRQAGDDQTFGKIIADIEKYLGTLPDPLTVPYTTRIYLAQLAK